MKKLKCVLLVDDDEVTNMYNRLIIDKLHIADCIQDVSDGIEALDYIKGEQNPKPDLIFLDMNMPRMNGYKFLEAFRELPKEQKQAHITVMLTIPLIAENRNQVESFDEVKGFATKPLSADYVLNMVDNFFN